MAFTRRRRGSGECAGFADTVYAPTWDAPGTKASLTLEADLDIDRGGRPAIRLAVTTWTRDNTPMVMIDMDLTEGALERVAGMVEGVSDLLATRGGRGRRVA